LNLAPVNHGGLGSRYAGQLRQVPRFHLTGRTGPTPESRRGRSDPDQGPR